MQTVFVEATQAISGGFNWGKFAVARFGPAEWIRPAHLGGPGRSLLTRCGWSADHTWVMDLQTGEGVFIRPGGSASADLAKHQVWVCPMFEPFLTWLYDQDLTRLADLPPLVELPKAEASFAGYRRPGRPGRGTGWPDP